MARKPKGSLKPTLHELSTAIDEAIGEISEEVYAAVDRGLDKAARHMEQALEAATPVDIDSENPGEVKRSWKVDFKYRNVRYINNTATRPKLRAKKSRAATGKFRSSICWNLAKKGSPLSAEPYRRSRQR